MTRLAFSVVIVLGVGADRDAEWAVLYILATGAVPWAGTVARRFTLLMARHANLFTRLVHSCNRITVCQALVPEPIISTGQALIRAWAPTPV